MGCVSLDIVPLEGVCKTPIVALGLQSLAISHLSSGKGEDNEEILCISV